GIPSIALELPLPVGAGWRAASRGFRYRDFRGSSRGVTSAQVKAGTDGAARVSVKGRGGALGLPALPLRRDDEVVVQLVAPPACFEARYRPPLLDTPTEFKARSD